MDAILHTLRLPAIAFLSILLYVDAVGIKHQYTMVSSSLQAVVSTNYLVAEALVWLTILLWLLNV